MASRRDLTSKLVKTIHCSIFLLGNIICRRYAIPIEKFAKCARLVRYDDEGLSPETRKLKNTKTNSQSYKDHGPFQTNVTECKFKIYSVLVAF